MAFGADIFIPPPQDWQEFEKLCRSLWQCIWNDPDAQLNGRSGQPQCGVDVFGQIDGIGAFHGVQCKGRSGDYRNPLDEKIIREEVEKAKTFPPPLGTFIIATVSVVDANHQALARLLTKENEKNGLFRVLIYGWGAIQEKLKEHPRIIGQYWPQLAFLNPAILDKLSVIERDIVTLSAKMNFAVNKDHVPKLNHLACYDLGLHGYFLLSSFEYACKNTFTINAGQRINFINNLRIARSCLEVFLSKDKMNYLAHSFRYLPKFMNIDAMNVTDDQLNHAEQCVRKIQDAVRHTEYILERPSERGAYRIGRILIDIWQSQDNLPYKQNALLQTAKYICQDIYDLILVIVESRSLYDDISIGGVIRSALGGLDW